MSESSVHLRHGLLLNNTHNYLDESWDSHTEPKTPIPKGHIAFRNEWILVVEVRCVGARGQGGEAGGTDGT